MEQDKSWGVIPEAIIEVSDRGNFITKIGDQVIPAEIGEFGPKIGAIIFYDNKGIPNRAMFLEAIG